LVTIRVTCQQYCTSYESGEETFVRFQCGIPGSYTDFIPMFLTSEDQGEGEPPIIEGEGSISFSVLLEPIPPSPPIRRAVLFNFSGFKNGQTINI
jgi:hypothetical protein